MRWFSTSALVRWQCMEGCQVDRLHSRRPSSCHRAQGRLFQRTLGQGGICFDPSTNWNMDQITARPHRDRATRTREVRETARPTPHALSALFAPATCIPVPSSTPTPSRPWSALNLAPSTSTTRLPYSFALLPFVATIRFWKCSGPRRQRERAAS